MRGRGRPGGPLGRWMAAALLCALSAPATLARAAPQGASCLVPTVGSPSCAAGNASAAPGSAVASNGPGLHVGNPIEVTGGNKYQREIDYRAFGTGLAFVRHYNSLLADEDLGLGPGWRHTYHVSLAALEGGGLRLRQSDGRALDFAHVPGTRRPEVHVGAAADGLIAHDSGRSRWYLPDGRRLDFEGPRLVRLDWGDARGALDILYRNGRVARVVDRTGRALELRYVERADALPAYGETGTRYRPPGALDSLVLPDGTRTRFEYDAERPLAAAVHADGARVDYGYTDVDWLPPLLATRRATPTGGAPGSVTETRWRYDADGLAVGVSGAVGLDVERVPDGPHAGTATVRWHDGRVAALSWSDDGRALASDGFPVAAMERRTAPRRVARAPTELEALADAALATLRTVPDEDGSTLLATLAPGGRAAPLRMRADRHGNLDLSRLGATDLEALLASGAMGALPSCGEGRPDDAEIVGRLMALAGGATPCAADVLVTFALEDSLERRQRARPPARGSGRARLTGDGPRRPARRAAPRTAPGHGPVRNAPATRRGAGSRSRTPATCRPARTAPRWRRTTRWRCCRRAPTTRARAPATGAGSIPPRSGSPTSTSTTPASTRSCTTTPRRDGTRSRSAARTASATTGAARTSHRVRGSRRGSTIWRMSWPVRSNALYPALIFLSLAIRWEGDSQHSPR